MAKGTKTLNSAIKVDDDGNMFFKLNAAPDDGDLANGEVVFYLNPAGPKLEVKTKSGGVVYSGEVASLS